MWGEKKDSEHVGGKIHKGVKKSAYHFSNGEKTKGGGGVGH